MPIDKKAITSGKFVFQVTAPKGDFYTFKITKKRTKNFGTVFYFATMDAPGNKGRFERG